MLRALALLISCAALPAPADTPSNAAVARWFNHCATFDSTGDVVSGLSFHACIDRAMQMCCTIEDLSPRISLL